MWETWVQSLGWEDPLEKGKAYPLQHSGLENSMECIGHGVAKSQTRLSDFHFHRILVYQCLFLLQTTFLFSNFLFDFEDSNRHSKNTMSCRRDKQIEEH